MNDYMTALRQRFFREPDFTELEEEIEQTRQEVRDCLNKLQRRKLMQLVDAQNLLREKTSLASFIAGFKLAWGIVKELEADGLYSFDYEQEQLVCKAAESGRTDVGKGDTPPGMIPRPASGSSRMCWARPKRRSRKN